MEGTFRIAVMTGRAGRAVVGRVICLSIPLQVRALGTGPPSTSSARPWSRVTALGQREDTGGSWAHLNGVKGVRAGSWTTVGPCGTP
jgi:hypothetical protein